MEVRALKRPHQQNHRNGNHDDDGFQRQAHSPVIAGPIIRVLFLWSIGVRNAHDVATAIRNGSGLAPEAPGDGGDETAHRDPCLVALQHPQVSCCNGKPPSQVPMEGSRSVGPQQQYVAGLYGQFPHPVAERLALAGRPQQGYAMPIQRHKSGYSKSGAAGA